MPEKLVVQAPAKLNLTLDITGIAPNGYHRLDMVMQEISLCDTVVLEEADELKLICPSWLPGAPHNLAWRAAERLREAAGVKRGARIELVKRIPAEAGMGGGSADAAAVIHGLNRLWGLGLGRAELCRIGLDLGSDVPFALAGGTARVRGVGEAVEPVCGTPGFWFLIAKPAGGVGTAEAYRRYDELGAARRPHNGRFVEAMLAGDLHGMARFGGNALERAACSILPAVGEALALARGTGAVYCAMTGSGAAVFAVFTSREEAEKASEKLGRVHFKAVACSY